MTNKERFEEIEAKRKSEDDVWLTSEDEQYLIDRVKALTALLEENQNMWIDHAEFYAVSDQELWLEKVKKEIES